MSHRDSPDAERGVQGSPETDAQDDPIIAPKAVWLPGEGEQWLFPMSVLREAYPDSFNNFVLPRLVEDIKTNDGVAVMNAPEADAALPTLWAVIGASGVGKSTILEQFSETESDIAVLTTASSRPRRKNENHKPYTTLPAPLPGELRGEYGPRVNLKRYNLLDETWYYGNVYGLPEVELAKVPSGKTSVVGTAPTSIWQLKYNLARRYNVVTVGIVPESFSGLFDIIESERGDETERSYRAGRAALDTLDIPRVANYAVLNPRNSEADGGTSDGAEDTARKITQLISSLKTSS